MSNVLYASVVGSLMYAIVCIRSDIGYVVGVANRFTSNPGKEHWAVMKWILWYLKSTSSVCLRFGSCKPPLEVLTYSNMWADVDTSRSTLGYVITYVGGAVSWQSRLQKVMPLSTTKFEYMATAQADKEIIWMKEFISELGIRLEEFRLHYDNQSDIPLAKNATHHSRTKHIQRRYHWLREWVEEKEFALMKIHTAENGPDMLTKVLSAEKLDACRERVRLVKYPMSK